MKPRSSTTGGSACVWVVDVDLSAPSKRRRQLGSPLHAPRGNRFTRGLMRSAQQIVIRGCTGIDTVGKLADCSYHNGREHHWHQPECLRGTNL
eukprot:6213278-Pleurochrysis_carterae.AAC.2